MSGWMPLLLPRQTVPTWSSPGPQRLVPILLPLSQLRPPSAGARPLLTGTGRKVLWAQVWQMVQLRPWLAMATADSGRNRTALPPQFGSGHCGRLGPQCTQRFSRTVARPGLAGTDAVCCSVFDSVFSSCRRTAPSSLGPAQVVFSNGIGLCLFDQSGRKRTTGAELPVLDLYCLCCDLQARASSA